MPFRDFNCRGKAVFGVAKMDVEMITAMRSWGRDHRILSAVKQMEKR